MGEADELVSFRKLHIAIDEIKRVENEDVLKMKVSLVGSLCAVVEQFGLCITASLNDVVKARKERAKRQREAESLANK